MPRRSSTSADAARASFNLGAVKAEIEARSRETARLIYPARATLGERSLGHTCGEMRGLLS